MKPQKLLADFYTQFVDENKWENDNYMMVLNVWGLTIKNKKTGEFVKLITQ